jgi:asparagine synthase (glutamine-hydrolysing)
MCGLAGAFFPSSGNPAVVVAGMTDYLRRRGPDAAGHWADEATGIALGHRRLSIIDLDPRSNQPLRSGDGRYLIIFNGEIYNYRALRGDLERAGVSFRTQGDAEVILELYARRGVAVFQMLRGMFALAIWDTQTRTLLLARDPYGIKPLYYARSAHGTLFASQVKALMATGVVSRASDPAGVAGFFLWGSVPEPHTLYSDVRPVPAGAYMMCTAAGPAAPVVYADLAALWRTQQANDSDIAERVRGAIADSLDAHLVADVPVAVFLSGGVDSGVVAGLMAERRQAPVGITIRFDEFSGSGEDETPRARQLAQYYGIESVVRTVTAAEFVQDIPAILGAMDQPSIDGVNTWFASKAVAERGFKVVLSGVGGDELFCGYSSFRDVPRFHAVGRQLQRLGSFGQITDKVLGVAARQMGKPKLASFRKFSGSFEGAYLLRRAVMMPDEVQNLMGEEAALEGLQSLLAEQAGASTAAGFEDVLPSARVAAMESVQYLRNQLLRDSDWASMAHSLELRTPFVDWKLAQNLAPHTAAFEAGRGKQLLANSPIRPLPGDIVNHPKTGFGLPMAKWLSQHRGGGSEVPATMRAPWARQWAWAIAEEFGFSGAVGHVRPQAA